MHEHEQGSAKEQENVPAAGKEEVLAPRLRKAWPVFTETFATWRNHWKLLTGIQIVWAAVFLATIILGAMAIGFATASSGVFSGALTEQEITARIFGDPGLLAVMVVIGLVAAAILVLISTWMSLATVQAWDWVRKEQHEDMSVRRAYAATWELVPGFIWVTILAVALVVIGLFGLVLPGIMLAIAFSVLSAVVVLERRKGKDAIIRTTTLARPHLLALFWRMLVAGAVLYIPAEIVASILDEMAQGIGDALNQMYGLVVSPVMTGVLLATYYEMKGAEKKARFLVSLSLERMAFIGALIAAAILAVALIVN